MIEAYIFIECTSGKTKDALSGIKEIEGIKTAHAVTGQYDLICFAQANDLHDLGEIIVTKIQGIPGVLRTITSMVVSF
jgi:anthranilate phosphoribosyltransferase